jgi:lysozyme family protein
MADFRQAVQKTLINEGGYVNDPNDKGGPTKYGITQADMPGIDIATITQEQAIAYYSAHYWKDLYSQINDQLLAEKLFDMGVLFGVGTAVRLLQISMMDVIGMVSDGAFGPNTLAAVNQEPNLLPAYRHTLLAHCVNVVTNSPNDSEFVQGWIRRINT